MSRNAFFSDGLDYANSSNDPQLTYEMPDISPPPKPTRPPPKTPTEDPVQPVPAHRNAPAVQRTPKKSKPILTIIIVVLLLIVTVLLILFLVLQFTQGGGNNSDNLTSGAVNNNDANPLKLVIIAGANGDTQPSCSAWKKEGFTTSGIYKVSGDPNPYYVFCDMTTADGGWNLVASVHVADIQTPCSSDDMWSRNPAHAPIIHSQPSAGRSMYRTVQSGVTYGMPYSERVSSGSSNWWNKTTFGNLNAVTSADYKSETYYTVPASDVMLVHVPNDTPLNKIDERSFLKYHTNDGFLRNYSSSLATFFGEHARLKSLTNLGINQGILKNLAGNSGLSSMIPGYLPFKYTDNDLSNEDITECKVFFRFDDRPFQRLQFQTTYTDSTTYNIGSIKSQPFVALASLSSLDGYPQKFEMKVVATAKHSGRRTSSSISLQYNSGTIRMWYLSIYNTEAYSGAAYASVFFAYSKTHTYINGYNSRYEPSTTNLTSSAAYYMQSAGNALFGYTLMITRNSSDSKRVNREVVQAVVRRIIEMSGDIRDLKPPQSFIFPVVFDKNANITLEQKGVDVGFLQFRAYDTYGHPYAICPAVSLAKSADPALFCIGSADTSRYEKLRDRCGDFPAWNKLPEHVIQDRNTVPGGHFVNDIHSSILIFTR